jgi:hypothetical protein
VRVTHTLVWSMYATNPSTISLCHRVLSVAGSGFSGTGRSACATYGLFI